MFGYVKKNEVIKLLESELNICSTQQSINSKLAATAADDEERTRRWILVEEFMIRYNQTSRILSKLRRTM